MRLILLALWSFSGVLAALVLGPRATGRLAWAPMASLLGPMWAVVAVEQRGLDRDDD